jgi:FHS family L-fucose permease-like MFS transporter
MPLAQLDTPIVRRPAATAGVDYRLALVLVTSLFFMWGLSYGLLDVLNKNFQETLHVSKQWSTLLQAAYFGAYFVTALPAGQFMQKFGYKPGIILGLILYACGALLFYPSAEHNSFPLFLSGLFVIATGLTFLETAANPYVTVLGKPETAAFRLNLAQSFNGAGSVLGPIIGGALFFGGHSGTAAEQLGAVKLVYGGIACTVVIVALLFARTRMPEIETCENVQAGSDCSDTLFKRSHFLWAVAAQFAYVAAQVGIAALFINYCTEQKMGISNQFASYLLSASLVLFTVGRFTGTALMKKIAAHRLLAIYAAAAMGLCSLVVWGTGVVSVVALMAIFFFASIMFPTIFALGIADLGGKTKTAASFIIMSIVGGAVMPVVMGALAQNCGTPFSYVVPMGCFAVVLLFAVHGYRVRPRANRSPVLLD